MGVKRPVHIPLRKAMTSCSLVAEAPGRPSTTRRKCLELQKEWEVKREEERKERENEREKGRRVAREGVSAGQVDTDRQLWAGAQDISREKYQLCAPHAVHSTRPLEGCNSIQGTGRHLPRHTRTFGSCSFARHLTASGSHLHS
jgi:hypothetical protein